MLTLPEIAQPQLAIGDEESHLDSGLADLDYVVRNEGLVVADHIRLRTRDRRLVQQQTTRLFFTNRFVADLQSSITLDIPNYYNI